MGRQLVTFGNNTYTYNEDGIRTSKTVDNVTTTYYLDETNIIEQITGNTVLHFYYDSNNEIIGFEYNGANYYYVKNAMSDIVGIADSDGNLITSYQYDPWGKVLAITGSQAETIGTLNPFRYKSYYYDSDTELYYLQSRYYDPETGRFINCDDPEYIGVSDTFAGWNGFAYCENDPVNNSDPSGYALSNIVGGIVGGVLGALLGYIIADAFGLTGWKRWTLISAITVAGAAIGAIIGPYVAKASRHIINVINSGIRKASNAALKASKNVTKWNVKSKHLSNAAGKYSKFASSDRNVIRSWVSEGLRSPNAVFYPDENGYYILVNMGKTIGTKGERIIKVCFTVGGFIKSAFPVGG